MFSTNVRQKIVSIFAQAVNFLLNAIISFVITPYIINTLGEEVYGFVGLANNYIMYIQLFTVGINTMINRFLIIEINKKRYDNAASYLSTICIYNLVLIVILVPIIVFIIFNLENYLDLPKLDLKDIRILWAFLYLGFLVETILQPFASSVIAMNRYDLNSRQEIIGNTIKVVIIVLGFLTIGVNVWLIGLGTIAYTLVFNFSMVHFMKKNFPKIKVRYKYFSLEKLLRVAKLGAWTTFTKVSQICSSGLDLLLANLFIDASTMGVLSIAKTIPTFIVNFFTSLSYVFHPELYQFYSNEQYDEMAKMLKESMRFLVIISTIPYALLIGFGISFYEIWIPSQNSIMLYSLSVITLANSCITGPLQPIYSLYNITGKVRLNSFVMIIFGFVSLGLTFLCLQFTNWGVYAIAGIAVLLSIGFALFFHAPFGAIVVKKKWFYFYDILLKSVILLIISSSVSYVLNVIISPENYFELFAGFIISGVICLLIEMCVLFSKKEICSLLQQIRKKIGGLWGYE